MFFSTLGFRGILFRKRNRRIRRGPYVIKFRRGRRTYRLGRLISRVKLYFRRRWYRPFHRGRQWFLRLGRRNCRVIQRGRRWMLHYIRRWYYIRRFMIRVRRTFRTVTRQRGRFYITFKGRKVRFSFRRVRYFTFHGRRTIVRRKKIGRRLFYKFRIKGRWTLRRIRRRAKRKLPFFF